MLLRWIIVDNNRPACTCCLSAPQTSAVFIAGIAAGRKDSIYFADCRHLPDFISTHSGNTCSRLRQPRLKSQILAVLLLLTCGGNCTVDSRNWAAGGNSLVCAHLSYLEHSTLGSAKLRAGYTLSFQGKIPNICVGQEIALVFLPAAYRAGSSAHTGIPANTNFRLPWRASHPNCLCFSSNLPAARTSMLSLLDTNGRLFCKPMAKSAQTPTAGCAGAVPHYI